MSCDRIAEALHHLPEKQLTGRNRLERFKTQISRPGTPSITQDYLYAAVFAPAFLIANLIEAANGSIHFNECEDAIRPMTSRIAGRCFAIYRPRADSRQWMRADLLALGISAIGGYVGRGWIGALESHTLLRFERLLRNAFEGVHCLRPCPVATVIPRPCQEYIRRDPVIAEIG
jgi:hypothetical protein